MRNKSLRRTLLAAVTLSLAACATAGSDPSVCPKLVAYTSADQARAADELSALAADSMLVQMIEDYGRERAQLRACQ